MPKMFIHSTENTFSPDAREQVAKALTNLGMRCEKLIDSEKIRNGVWVFFEEHGAQSVFSGGEAVSTPQIAMVTFAIRGGLDVEARKTFIGEATEILGKHAGTRDVPTPIYVVISEIPEEDWGMYGKQVDLTKMQKA
jgi:phenylpyruvate tautomerase PptA (4-oxalocrotonate tautomerase family)